MAEQTLNLEYPNYEFLRYITCASYNCQMEIWEKNGLLTVGGICICGILVI